MRYAAMRSFDVTNGPGNGVSLFVQGCPYHCKFCFNPETWDFNDGKIWDNDVEDIFFKHIGRSYISRVSILGGSPLCDENVIEVERLVRKIKTIYPDKQIWIYTGYTWESIWNQTSHDDPMKKARREIMRYINVLVDGPFEYDKKDLSLAFRGSSNQRIIDVQESLKKKTVVEWSGET